MVLLHSIVLSVNSLLLGGESSKPNMLLANIKPSPPEPGLFAKRNSSKSRGVAFLDSHIEQVLGVGGNSEIMPSVIQRVMVSVIHDHPLWGIHQDSVQVECAVIQPLERSGDSIKRTCALIEPCMEFPIRFQEGEIIGIDNGDLSLRERKIDYAHRTPFSLVVGGVDVQASSPPVSIR